MGFFLILLITLSTFYLSVQVNESPIYWSLSIIDSDIMKELVDIWDVDVNSTDRVSCYR